MANIVTLNSTHYHIDVGFGLNTPPFPVPFPPVPLSSPTPLTPHPTSTVLNRKLTQQPLLSTSHPLSPPVWIYHHRARESDPWIPGYTFSAIEFHEEDYRVMNLMTMTSPASFFVQSVICVRTFLSNEALPKTIGGEEAKSSAEGEEEPRRAGQIVLFNDEVKLRRLKPGFEDEYGEYVVIEKFESEEARVEALRKWFGIRLSEEERRAIVGTSTEIKAPA